jgi:hypothetical protein
MHRKGMAKTNWNVLQNQKWRNLNGKMEEGHSNGGCDSVPTRNPG